MSSIPAAQSTPSLSPADRLPSAASAGPPHGRGGKTGHAPASVPPPHRESDSVELNRTSSGEREPGIVRLLRQGHFKGVAELRLRMNHADHFTSPASAAAQHTPASADSLVSALHDRLEQLPGADELDEGTAEQVQAAVTHFEQSVADVADDPQAVTDALSAARDGVIDALGQALLPLGESPTDETTGEVESVIGEGERDAVTSWLADLDAALGTLIDDLTAWQPGTLDTLPPLSEPSGRGVAYDRFLAQYQQMMGLTPDAGEGETDAPASPGDDTLDALA